jgi:hypothetical protein
VGAFADTLAGLCEGRDEAAVEASGPPKSMSEEDLLFGKTLAQFRPTLAGMVDSLLRRAREHAATHRRQPHTLRVCVRPATDPYRQPVRSRQAPLPASMLHDGAALTEMVFHTLQAFPFALGVVNVGFTSFYALPSRVVRGLDAYFGGLPAGPGDGTEGGAGAEGESERGKRRRIETEPEAHDGESVWEDEGKSGTNTDGDDVCESVTRLGAHHHHDGAGTACRASAPERDAAYAQPHATRDGDEEGARAHEIELIPDPGDRCSAMASETKINRQAPPPALQRDPSVIMLDDEPDGGAGELALCFGDMLENAVPLLRQADCFTCAVCRAALPTWMRAAHSLFHDDVA